MEKNQKYYSTDQVIEIINSIKIDQTTNESKYINKIANAIVEQLEKQRPLKRSLLDRIFGL